MELGSSQVNPFNGPALPLAVCRSTSTVGLPLESRISRAKIFCMAMAAGREVLVRVDSWTLKEPQIPCPLRVFPPQEGRCWS